MIFFVVFLCFAGYSVVPDAPINCSSTAIYRELSGLLISIDNTWNTVPVSCHKLLQ